MKKLPLLLVDDNPDDRVLTIRELKKKFNVQIAYFYSELIISARHYLSSRQKKQKSFCVIFNA